MNFLTRKSLVRISMLVGLAGVLAAGAFADHRHSRYGYSSCGRDYGYSRYNTYYGDSYRSRGYDPYVVYRPRYDRYYDDCGYRSYRRSPRFSLIIRL